MAVSVQQMAAQKSLQLRERCDRLEATILNNIEAAWSPGATIAFKVTNSLVDSYTLEEMGIRFPGWKIESWSSRDFWGNYFIRISEKERLSLDQAIGR